MDYSERVLRPSLGIIALFMAGIATIGYADVGLQSLGTVIAETVGALLHPLLYALIPPGLFVLLSAPLIIRPSRSSAAQASTDLFAFLVVLTVVHEVRWRMVGAQASLITETVVGLANWYGVVVAGIALRSNQRNPSLATAYVFNGVLVAWLCTVAFPWFSKLWRPVA